MRKNDLNRAERSFNEALDGLKRAETPAEAALTLNNVGGLLSSLTKVVSASERAATLNKFGNLVEGLKKTAAPSERAQTLNNLGNVYIKRENWSKALDYYQKSLEIKTNIGDQFGAANTHSNQGTVYQMMANEASGKKQAELRQQAVSYFTRSYEVYKTFGARSNQAKLLYKLALIYSQAGDKANARAVLQDALAIFEDLEMPEFENASKLEKQLG
jgi:tetratricopeptide (TPR) repeat protein